MVDAIQVSPAHHRPLPAAAASAPSSSVSLRPHQSPPPPPAAAPAGIDPEPPRHRLQSMVVGHLDSLLGMEEAPDALLEEVPVAAVVDGAAGGLASPPSPSSGLPDLPQPPPPAELPPNFTPVHISDAPEVSTERAWVEVGGRRRPRPEKKPAPSSRKEAGLSPAFKRQTYGLCFRCLEPDHFVTDCRGPVRCLSCRQADHRERDCPTRHSARQEPHHHSSSPPAPPRRPKTLPQEPRTGSRPPPAPSDRLQRSWASVAANQDAIIGEATYGLGEAGTVAGICADASRSLQPFLEAQAVALSAELQALFVARLEEVFSPLRDLVAAVQGWSDQVSGLWELMEDLGGRLGLALSLLTDKIEEAAPLAVSEDKDASAAAGASCSPELGGLMVQHFVDPPEVVSAPFETMTQGLEEQQNVDEVVAACKDVELAEVILANNSLGRCPWSWHRRETLSA